MKRFNTKNANRFALHILFGAAALSITWLVENLDIIELPNEVEYFIAAFGTSLASFLRRESQENG